MAFNLLSELPAIHALEDSREVSSTCSSNSLSGSTKMISAHSNTSIASNESSTVAATSSDNISTLSTDNSDTYMSDSESKTISSATEPNPFQATSDSHNFTNESVPINTTGSLTPHELKHHSVWATNIEIQDKSVPDFPSTQTIPARGETRIRGGKPERSEDKQLDINLKYMNNRVCGLQTLHLAHNAFSGAQSIYIYKRFPLGITVTVNLKTP